MAQNGLQTGWENPRPRGAGVCARPRLLYCVLVVLMAAKDGVLAGVLEIEVEKLAAWSRIECSCSVDSISCMYFLTFVSMSVLTSISRRSLPSF